MPGELHYQPTGTPLTEREREILIILAEECAEVIHAASKLLRFGKVEKHPGTNFSNTEVLSQEIGDLRYLLTMVRHIGLSDRDIEVKAQERKHDRMRWFMQSKP